MRTNDDRHCLSMLIKKLKKKLGRGSCVTHKQNDISKEKPYPVHISPWYYRICLTWRVHSYFFYETLLTTEGWCFHCLLSFCLINNMLLRILTYISCQKFGIVTNCNVLKTNSNPRQTSCPTCNLISQFMLYLSELVDI